ncbi:MAG: histone family protein [Rhodocyclaceae bacterium]|nr:histone family protein [Rhodocyclaceae bacterium]
MDISSLSLADLKRLLTQIPKEIERRQKDEKVRVLKEIEAIAAERGFALDELVGGGVKKLRAPVAVKYRHPGNADLSWTGRGRQPKWVQEFVQNGGSLDQLKAG